MPSMEMQMSESSVITNSSRVGWRARREVRASLRTISPYDNRCGWQVSSFGCVNWFGCSGASGFRVPLVVHGSTSGRGGVAIVAALEVASVSDATSVGLAGQPAQGDLGGFGECLAPKHFADAVCVGAQHLNDIGEGDALMPQNMCGNGLFHSETFSFYCDIVEFDPVGVAKICHGLSPLGNVVRRLLQGLRTCRAAFVRAAALLSGSRVSSPRSGLPLYHIDCAREQGVYSLFLAYIELQGSPSARGGA